MIDFHAFSLLVCLFLAADEPAQRKKEADQGQSDPKLQRELAQITKRRPQADNAAAQKDAWVDVFFAGISSDPQLQRELAQINKDARTLLKEKRDAIRATLALKCGLVLEGKKSLDLDLLECVKRLSDTELELANDPKERVAALERRWLLLRKFDMQTEMQSKTGVVSADVASEIRYFRLEAEIEYVKEKAKLVK
jgi:hypothetical protein